jgi:hypothetical protein
MGVIYTGPDGHSEQERIAMNLTNLRAELVRVEKKKESLQRRIDGQLATKIKALPASVGLSSIDALVEALLPRASTAFRSKLKVRSPQPDSARKAAPGRRGYPDEVKERVHADIKRGDLTLAQVSARHGPSVATLMSWKRIGRRAGQRRSS